MKEVKDLYTKVTNEHKELKKLSKKTDASKTETLIADHKKLVEATKHLYDLFKEFEKDGITAEEIEKMKKLKSAYDAKTSKHKNPCDSIVKNVRADAKEGKYVFETVSGEKVTIDINNAEDLKKIGLKETDLTQSGLKKFRKQQKKATQKEFKESSVAGKAEMLMKNPIGLSKRKDPVVLAVMAQMDQALGSDMKINETRYNETIVKSKDTKRRMSVQYDMTDRKKAENKITQKYMTGIAKNLGKKRIKGYKSDYRLEHKKYDRFIEITTEKSVGELGRDVKKLIDDKRAEKLEAVIEDITLATSKEEQYKALQELLKDGKISGKNAKFLVRRLDLKEQQKADRKKQKE